jgi:hypothetical protein
MRGVTVTLPLAEAEVLWRLLGERLADPGSGSWLKA